MTKNKVAMLVSNPCNPDYRVVKEAESLAKAGYEVRVFCVWQRGLAAPVFEEINGVTYVRREWNPVRVLRQYLFGESAYSQIPLLSRRGRGGLPKTNPLLKPTFSLSSRWLRNALSKLLFNRLSLMRYRSYEIVFSPLLVEWRPQVIHAHDGVTLPAAANAAKKLGARLVFDSHELETHRNPPLSWVKRKQVEQVERAYLPEADRVITVANLLADHLAKEYSITRPEVLFNAPENSVENLHPRWDVPSRTDVRSELNLDPRKFLFVYTGRATVNRGLELAIIALSKLQGFRDPEGRFDSDYHLVAVGGIQSGHDARLLGLAKVYGVTEHLHFVPAVAPQRVASFIASANASIIPIIPVTLSYEFAMPNKLFEAMLAGLPIIGADLAEMGAFIESNRLGLTYAADSPDDCVEKMIDLITRFAQFRRGEERQHELTTRYSWRAQEETLLAAYRHILSGKTVDNPLQADHARALSAPKLS